MNNKLTIRIYIEFLSINNKLAIKIYFKIIGKIVEFFYLSMFYNFSSKKTKKSHWLIDERRVNCNL